MIGAIKQGITCFNFDQLGANVSLALNTLRTLLTVSPLFVKQPLDQVAFDFILLYHNTKTFEAVIMSLHFTGTGRNTCEQFCTRVDTPRNCGCC
jgi:hypothetical protein